MKENSQFKHVLHLDFDYPIAPHWMEEWRKHVYRTLKAYNMEVEEIIVKPSPSREGGLHIWIKATSPVELSDDNINMLQWLLCDHQVRVWINTLRIERGLRKFWNKLFTRHLWRKPLPKQCQKCVIRRYVNEMREEWLKCHGS